MTTVLVTAPRKSLLHAIRCFSLSGLVSLRYMFLRVSTAGGALIAGLVQTFVFARVLPPDQFSLFLLVGALGITMWLFDLGVPKILFVQLRERYLARDNIAPLAAQATALTILYGALVAAGGLICFAIMAMRPAHSLWDVAQFSLFFFFSAFNLAWFVLRNVSVAIDEYIFFEVIEALRRIVYILLLLVMLIGLPFSAFVILINASWVLVFAVTCVRLVRRGALAPQIRGVAGCLLQFFRDHWLSALRTGAHAAGEAYIHNSLYIAVPLAYGLGAPTIIADTALKIFFGTVNLCSAACDLLVPRQTAAYAQRDSHTLLRAVIMAFALCTVPVLAVTALLLFDAEHLFALLLGSSAIMPAELTPIIIVLLATAAAKQVPNFLLQYTGYFRDIARLSLLNALLMTAALGTGVYVGIGLVGLLAIYASVFAAVTVFYIVLAIRGPLRDAQTTAGTSHPILNDNPRNS